MPQEKLPNINQQQGALEELKKLMEEMDFPKVRYEELSEANLKWLDRNLNIQHKDNPDSIRIKKILEELGYAKFCKM